MRRRGALLFAALVGTFVLVRLWLHASPNTDLNVGRWNIHHLFTGVLLIAVSAPPLALSRRGGRLRDAACLALGAGLALALDEWVYLIVTDGSNAAYLLPVSLWGGVVLVGVCALWVLWWWRPWRAGEDDR